MENAISAINQLTESKQHYVALLNKSRESGRNDDAERGNRAYYEGAIAGISKAIMIFRQEFDIA